VTWSNDPPSSSSLTPPKPVTTSPSPERRGKSVTWSNDPPSSSSLTSPNPAQGSLLATAMQQARPQTARQRSPPSHTAMLPSVRCDGSHPPSTACPTQPAVRSQSDRPPHLVAATPKARFQKARQCCPAPPPETPLFDPDDVSQLPPTALPNPSAVRPRPDQSPEPVHRVARVLGRDGPPPTPKPVVGPRNSPRPMKLALSAATTPFGTDPPKATPGDPRSQSHVSHRSPNAKVQARAARAAQGCAASLSPR